MPKRAAVMQDLSGLGHCSLSASMAVLPVLGIQCCPVPACVLSTQTDGYTNYSFCDLTAGLDAYLSHWESLGERFDAVFTGYLGSAAQYETALRLIGMRKPGGIVLVDPVMGDGGSLYGGMDPQMPELMRRLIGKADVITPNLTEACLLAGSEYKEYTQEEAIGLAQALCAFGPSHIVISGIEHDGAVAVAGWDEGQPFYLETPRIPCSYPGSGDVFAAVLLGKYMSGASFRSAAQDAADFVGLCVRESARENAPRREGIVFEPHLRALLNA